MHRQRLGPLTTITIILALATLASACRSGSEQSSDGPATDSELSSSSSTVAGSSDEDQSEIDPVQETTIDPEAPAESQLEWFVSTLNDSGAPSATTLEERFDPAFLAEIPATQIVAVTESLFGETTPPFEIERFEANATGTAGAGTIAAADGQRFDVEIAVNGTAPYQIIGLLFTPSALDQLTVDEVDRALQELGSSSAAAVFEVTDGTCAAVAEIRSDESVVLGSVFKLWILAELANQIEAGTLAWDDEIEIRDALKSSPDGVFFDRQAGEMVTLEELATEMIAISDNTATDHLLAHLGRQNVEEALTRIGIEEASANIPMLSTGNLFALKFLPDEPNAVDYRALDEAGRRAMLETLDASVLPWVDDSDLMERLAEEGELDEPRDLDIEWFATPADLCRTLVHLAELAEQPGLSEVADILERNPGQGIPFDRERFPVIRFKGGWEPGVLAGAWWFERDDGQRFVVAGGINNPDDAFNQGYGALSLASLITLVD